MFTATGKVLNVESRQAGKGTVRKVTLLSEDGRYDKAIIDVFSSQVIDIGKSVTIPVSIKLNESKGKTFLNITSWDNNGKSEAKVSGK